MFEVLSGIWSSYQAGSLSPLDDYFINAADALSRALQYDGGAVLFMPIKIYSVVVYVMKLKLSASSGALSPLYAIEIRRKQNFDKKFKLPNAKLSPYTLRYVKEFINAIELSADQWPGPKRSKVITQ